MATAQADLGTLGLRLLVRAEGALSPEERAASEGLRLRMWPNRPDYADDPDYRNPPAIRALLFDERREGVAIGTAVVLDCRLAVGTAPPRPVAGLAGVVVDAERRGQGLGEVLVRAVVGAAAESGYAFGALFCRPHLGPFYERLGWQALHGPVVKTLFGVEQPIRPGGLFMATPLNDAARAEFPSWREARVHVGVGQW